ncbi:uncharacterized protein PAC_06032 [Phialocephala subalpina]|uniref:Uncharacterized protein n=1 Tax=Phialocephala subalpina TaxID=576137 RepID=A0A1L7WTN6_9HELO|nr:uncharacterized protein PAC_06032 [Phialocephala subalpina]
MGKHIGSCIRYDFLQPPSSKDVSPLQQLIPLRISIPPVLSGSDASGSIASQDNSSDTQSKITGEAQDRQLAAEPRDLNLSPLSDLCLSWPDGASPSSVYSPFEGEWRSKAPPDCSQISNPEPIAPSLEAVVRISNIIGNGKIPWTFYWETPGRVKYYRASAVDSMPTYDLDAHMLMEAGLRWIDLNPEKMAKYEAAGNGQSREKDAR